ncbi:unnamed protein product [Rotaria sordida]|uniref:PAS domain-containing protein n=1 Tax=Rotaria sordida TaxID=392033 RepID=A0A814LFZ6_9BILA|nr:unnamed protein product [Rotaria sordida]
MSDGNQFTASAYAQQHQQNRLPFESMGNVLLDAMQGILICLDSYHIIIGVSKTVKRYFGFEQTDLVGLSILLLIEDSERDSFLKFLNSPSQPNDMHYVRIMTNNTNEYRQVKIHRKKKLNHDNANVHSTTTRHNYSVVTMLIITSEDSSYIDITLHDIHKQEFYTKMNLIGEIIFEDHRGALITGYLPHEILSQSIFDFVYYEDRLVKLHALWKCVTTGSSKLQWRLNARDGSLVFLQTEYKLISDHQNHDIIVARNEVLNPIQRSQFDELQTAWKHQCAADIKGNSSSFKFLSPTDTDSSSASNGQCRICVPSLRNIFGVSKLTRPLTIQDYIQILMDNDKHMDGELANMINNIQSLTACYRRLNDKTKSQSNGSDIIMDEKVQLESSPSLTDISSRQKHDSESIVRGILSNSIQYNHEKQSGLYLKENFYYYYNYAFFEGDSSSTLVRLLNGNGHSSQNGNTRSSTVTSQFQINQSKSNSTPLSPEIIHQQDVDFLKKYKAAKAKLESQLESIRRQETIDANQINDKAKRNTILNKLSQLENIKNKHFARRHIQKRQTSTTTTAVPIINSEQKDFLNSLFSSSPSSAKSIGLLPIDNNNPLTSSSPSSLFSSSNDQSPYYSSNNYQDQRNTSQQFDSIQTSSYHNVKPSLFDEFLTPPSSSYTPVNTPTNNNNNNSSTSVHSHMDISYQGTTDNLTGSSFSTNHQHNTNYPY